MVKKIFKYLFVSVFAVVLIIAAALTAMYFSADMEQPCADVDQGGYTVVERTGYSDCNGNMLRRSESGLWEVYLHGDALERGVAFGKLSEELLLFQESVFVERIREIVPSDGYLKFLGFFIRVFNRDLGEHVPQEYREEIYGMSLSCTHEYDALGSPYERQLNYHAAHDIGHVMQDYMLVGCSSFGVWGSAARDGELLIGRNFDFWVGDDFAKNKMVSFYAPDSGYRFACIGWAGMTGVLSGMNEKGLTVTLNAAKGSLPVSAATPISILAREILQYASNIDEALRIAESRRTFVSESLLIGSAEDGRAALIEKTPLTTALFESGSDHIISTNHYQSGALASDSHNVENMRTSDSPYRFARLKELISAAAVPAVRNGGGIGVIDAVSILRDRFGLGGEDIGLTNEKSLNQSIAHHSVIFKPSQRLMWVSTAPWQSGRYVCYDLSKIFASPDFSGEIYSGGMNIAADTVFLSGDYPKVLRHREDSKHIREAIASGERLGDGAVDGYIANNPQFYYVYKLAGDYYADAGATERARGLYAEALNKVIPRAGEREEIEKALKKLKK